MTHKFDKARETQNSDEKKELTIAIKQKIKMNEVTEQEFNECFKLAVKMRDALLVGELLDARPKLNATVGSQLLWEIINDDDTQIAEMLVQAGADVNTSFNLQSTSLLHVLAEHNNPKKCDLAELLIKRGANVNARNSDGCSVLQYTFTHENYTLAQELLKRKVVVDEDVLWTIARSQSPVKSLLLLVNGSHVKDLRTRRHLVSHAFKLICSFDIDERKIVDMTKALFDLGIPEVDVIVQAIRCNKIELMKSLLQRKDIYRRIKMEFLHCASGYQNSSKMARILVEWGADIEYPVDSELNDFNRGMRPLHAACLYKSVKNIQFLLHLGADVNATDSYGCTPLFYAFDNKLTESNRCLIRRVALLTSKGAAVNKSNTRIIESLPILRKFYVECLRELQRMKEVNVFKRISFYSILIKDGRRLVILIRRAKFLYDFKNSLGLFPLYCTDLKLQFETAERLRDLLTLKENALSEALCGILPDLPIEKIILHLYLNEIKIAKV